MTMAMKKRERSRVRTRDHLRVGKPDVRPSVSAHTPGNREGNQPGSYEKMRGHFDDDTSDAERSTGIGAEHKNPILPGMPNLSPP